MIEINTEEILDFIQPRQGVPIETELSIVEKQKEYYRKQLEGKRIYPEKIPIFKKELEKIYLRSLIQPGETVGIICGQCIGEKTTQSSLNNFHSAGLDTGSTSQIDSLQTIINASKVKKKEIRKYFRVSLFLKEPTKTVVELHEKTSHYLEQIKFGDLITKIHKNITYDIPDIFDSFLFSNALMFQLDLQKIFSYRISRKILLEKISQLENIEKVFCLPFSMLPRESTTIDVYVSFDCNVFELLKEIRQISIVGIEGVITHVFSQKNNGEWFIDCLCNSINIFFVYSHIYDFSRIICNSVNDMYNHFGILASEELIVEKCKEIMPDIDESHFRLLAIKMTKNGNIEPLTRYTMRNNSSPLTKASFEESFETFIKACKFKETEKFRSISSSIICGKKPQIGTYQCDVLIDPEFFN